MIIIILRLTTLETHFFGHPVEQEINKYEALKYFGVLRVKRDDL